MRADRLNKYIWIIDTISAHGCISRSELSDLWERSAFSDGNPFPHRTFFAYRRDIEQIFGIDIRCNSAYEYYIDKPEGPSDEAFRSWMLDSYAMRHAMNDARDISARIIVEKVPSARRFLAPILRAMRECRDVIFTYAGYTRPFPEAGIRFSPYFIRLFHQRWYVIGLRHSDHSVRTYALDRIADLSQTTHSFTMPADMNPADYFKDIFGMTYSHGNAETVKIKAGAYYANYLRALPLHPSQQEEIFSGFSVFTYRMKLTPDLVREIVSVGPDITVIEPRSLRLMVVEQLKTTLKNYEND